MITKRPQSINLVEFLRDVWGHVVAPQVRTLADFTPSAVGGKSGGLFAQGSDPIGRRQTQFLAEIGE
jgi:hypothetical protein